jgi:hypothetical protein
LKTYSEIQKAKLTESAGNVKYNIAVLGRTFRINAQTSDEASVTGVKARHACAAMKLAKDLAGALAKEKSED